MSGLHEKARRWLDVGDKALSTSNLTLARTAIRQAENSLELPDAIDDGVARGRCKLLRADLALQDWDLTTAQEHLDEATAALGDQERFRADLSRMTARLAERRGRYSEAIEAWITMERQLPTSAALRKLDARIRRAEACILAGEDGDARMLLHRVLTDPLLPLDPLLKGRADVLRATILELDRDYGHALRVYAEVHGYADALPPVFVGLLQLRMARPLVRSSPQAALRRIVDGHQLLAQGTQPDASGLALSQLAVVAIVLRRPRIAAIATVQAELWRGVRDGTTRPLLLEALEQLGFERIAQSLDPDAPASEDPALRTALEAEARILGVDLEQRSENVVRRLADALNDVERPDQPLAHSTLPFEGRGLLMQQRASLTWDAEAHPSALLPASALTATVPPLLPRTQETPKKLPWFRTGAAVAVFIVLSFVAGFAVAAMTGFLFG